MALVLVIKIFFLFVSVVVAFHSPSTPNNLVHTSRSRCGMMGRFPENRLNAYIFPGPDDNGECTYGMSGSYFQDDDNVVVPTTTTTKTSPASTAFMDFINREAAALARLAVAYSPADRTIDIKNINQVKLLNLSDGHIDIEAIVCDDVACVSLAVPVSFPMNCSDKAHTQAEFEFCVIDNLGELDRIASEAINKVVADEQQELQEIDAHRNQFGRPRF